ncbi:GDSL-type esterase/lipase family protein [Paraglaciecola aestuariivivens]
MSKPSNQTPLALIPCKSEEDWWLARHQQKLSEKQQLEQPLDLLFLGDSITHAWEVEGAEVWQQDLAHLTKFNLGFAGDRTEQLLWRIQHGQIEQLNPKFCIVLIGTNNAGHRLDPPKEIVLGIQAIVSELQLRLPQSQLVLMALLPRSRNPNKPMRQRIDATNLLLQNWAKTQPLIWLDINQKFLDKNGRLDEIYMPDLLHLSAKSYALWGQAILDLIEKNN